MARARKSTKRKTPPVPEGGRLNSYPEGRQPVVAADLAQAGIPTARHNLAGQQRLPMDLGKEENDYDRMATHLQRFADLPEAHQERVKTEQESTYGVTMETAAYNHGVMIDKSLATDRRGQHFYHGSGSDPSSQVGRDALIQRTREHGIPFHVLASVRGVLSPRSNVHDELTNLDAAVNHMKANPDHDGPIPGIGGLAGKANSTNAAALLRAHSQGIHPLDAERPAGKSGKMRRVLDPKGMPKVLSYIQGYTHPDIARPTIDTHAVGGMAPNLPKSAPKEGNGKFDAKGKEYQIPVKKSDPRWVPNQEDALGAAGAYEFYGQAASQAAAQRGLTDAEGQTLGWFPQRETGNQQPGTGNGAAKGVMNKQQEMFPLPPAIKVKKAK